MLRNSKTLSPKMQLLTTPVHRTAAAAVPLSQRPLRLRKRQRRGHSFYISGTFSEYYNDFKTPEFRKIIEKIILEQIHPTLKLSNCAGLVEPYIRYQPKQDRFVVHLPGDKNIS